MKKPAVGTKKSAGGSAGPVQQGPRHAPRHPAAVAVGAKKLTGGSAGPVGHTRNAKKPKKPKKPKPKRPVRKLAIGSEVACCSAQAVGTLLGLSDAEVLALYWLTADGPDDGASIEDTLAAASVLSRPAPEHSPPGADLWQAGPFVEPVHALILGLALPEGPHAVLATADGWWSWGELYDPGEFPGAVIEEAWAVSL